MKDVFKISKLKPLIKFKNYQYIGTHNSYEGINYYIRQYDNHNNYDFMEAKIEGAGKLFKKFILASGTTIKTLDSFMFSYLKHRKDKDIKTLLKKGFVESTLKENNFEEVDKLKKIYSAKVPADITKEDYYKDLIKKGYEVLYVKDTSSLNSKYNTVTLVMVKEEKQEIIGTDLSYVLFKTAEFVVRPSYVTNKGKDKYMRFDLPDLNIPVDILK